MNAARHKSTSNSITLTSTMMIGATTSQITTSQNVPPSNRSSLVVPSASPTTIPSALSTVNVTTDTCTSTCVVHQDSLWQWLIVCCVVFIPIHSIIIGWLYVSKLSTVMLLSTISNWRCGRDGRGGGGGSKIREKQ